ncbi:MAG: 50S ribosomal protein L29 [bacterium]|nr:50S ribosomal protein L29 [Candidatus Kapabacteria bacterium]
MKSTKSTDLRNMSDSELSAQIVDNERALDDMRFRMAVGQLENPAAIRTVRRDIARMQTILKEKSR